jgi:hypothetical protein
MFNIFKRVPHVIYNTVIAAALYAVPLLVLLAENGGDFPPTNI